MVRVLVAGANGLIGGNVAIALSRAGHTVYGLIRDKKQQDVLLQNEIIPVLGDTEDIKSFSDTIDKVSIVVDTVVLESASDPGLTNRNLLQAVAASSIKQKYKKRYIFTSGCMVYKNPGEIVDESSPTNNDVFKWRTDFEQKIIKHSDVEGVVIRPGWVYGVSGGGIADLWFNKNSDGEIDFTGDVDKSWSWVHVHDLADAFLRVVEAAGQIVGGSIYNVCDTTRITCLQARKAFAKAAGLTGSVVLKEAKDAFSKKVDANAVMSAGKIIRELGWTPKKGPLTDRLDICFQAWKAHKIKKSSQEEKKGK